MSAELKDAQVRYANSKELAERACRVADRDLLALNEVIRKSSVARYPHEIDGVPACGCGDPMCTDYKDMS
jgi:hypothetical protein